MDSIVSSSGLNATSRRMGGMKAIGVGRADLVAGAERIVKSLAEISYADVVGLWDR